MQTKKGNLTVITSLQYIPLKLLGELPIMNIDQGRVYQENREDISL